jgi:hypothetical protein
MSNSGIEQQDRAIQNAAGAKNSIKKKSAEAQQ